MNLVNCFLVSLLILLAGCNAQADHRAPLDDEQAINAMYDRFSHAYATLDPDVVANLYTTDALYLSGTSAISKGRTAIRANFASFFERSRRDNIELAISFRSVDRSFDDDLAFDVGYYQITFKEATGNTRTSVGKFVVVLKKQTDGSWQFHVDGYNSAPVEAFEQTPSE